MWTWIIVALIALYSAWIIYRRIKTRNSGCGCCDGCSEKIIEGKSKICSFESKIDKARAGKG